jgi:hypothetical protein
LFFLAEKRPNGQRPTPNVEFTAARFRRTDELRKNSMCIRRAHRSPVEQIIRPTGLLDPKITLKPL